MNEMIAKLLDREPFVPFDLVMSSGDRYGVRNPGLAILESSMITILRGTEERQDIIRLSNVGVIEVEGSI